MNLGWLHKIANKPFVKYSIRNLSLISERNLGKKKTQCNLINIHIVMSLSRVGSMKLYPC